MNITIQGRQVTVSDDFMNLSPEDQDATVDEIAQSMGVSGTQPPEVAPPMQDGGSALGAGIANAAQSVSLGFADEGKAGIKAGIDWMGGAPFGESYDKRLAETRGDLEARTTAHPYASMAGQVGGAFLLPGGALKSGASPGANALRGAAAGGALGAGYGFGTGEGGAASRARSAAVGGGIGAVTGGAAGAALSKVEQGLTNRATRQAVSEAAANAPTPSENWAAGDAAFEALKARGIKFEDTASARLLAGVRDGLADFDMDTAGPTLRRISHLASKSENGLSFTGLMNTRAALRTHTLNRGTSDAEAAKVAMGKIDEFMTSVMDADVKSGNVNTAGLGDDWKEARRLWTVFKKSDRIDKAITAAQDAPGGIEKGLKSEFRKILKKENLSPAEKQVVREVLRGSTFGNFIRMNAGPVAGYLGGHLLGGELGGAVGYGLGRAALRGADTLGQNATQEAAQRALGFVAGGGKYVQPAPVMLPPVTRNALMRGSYEATQGGVNLWNR